VRIEVDELLHVGDLLGDDRLEVRGARVEDGAAELGAASTLELRELPRELGQPPEVVERREVDLVVLEQLAAQVDELVERAAEQRVALHGDCDERQERLPPCGGDLEVPTIHIEAPVN